MIPVRRPGSLVVDVGVPVLVFVMGAVTAYYYLSGIGVRSFTEYESTPAAMLACGRGLTSPVTETPELVEFQMRRRPAVTCEQVVGAGGTKPPLAITLGERYGLYGAALAFRVAGISWRTLDAYMATLYGVSMVLAFGLFRLFAGRMASVLGVIALCFSGHLIGLETLRDYGKEPCFYAAWLALGWLLARGGGQISRKALAPAAVGGAVIGIGMGFRPDILVAAPVFLVMIAVGLPGFRLEDLKLKAAALAVWVLAFGVTAWPILSGMSGGSNTSHVVIMGLMTSFDRSLGLEPAPYDVGDTYSDGYVYTLITSHATLVQHEPQPVEFGTTRYDRLGVAVLGDVAKHFPADILIRAIGATTQVIRYPFRALERLYDLSSRPLEPLPRIRGIAENVGLALNTLEYRAVLLTVVVFVGLMIVDWRRGLLCGLLVVYFCSYSMLQFSRRHTFHLDIVPMAVLVLVLDTVLRGLWRAAGFARRSAAAQVDVGPGWTTRIRGGLIALATVAVVMGGTLWAARAWQQRHVTKLIDETLSLAWQDVATNPEPLTDTGEPVYAKHLDEWRTGVLMRLQPPGVTASQRDPADKSLETSYLLAAVGGPRCRLPMVRVATTYSGSEHTAHREYTRVFEVATSVDGPPTQLMVPAFYQYGTFRTNFDGFAVRAADAGCLQSVKRAVSVTDVPMPILTAVLPPDWRARPLFRRLAVDPWNEGPP